MKNITIALVLMSSPVMAQESITIYNPPAGAVAVKKSGDTMTGPLTLSGSSLTVTGNAFSVGTSTFVVTGGKVGIGVVSPVYGLDLDVDARLTNSRTISFNDTLATPRSLIAFPAARFTLGDNSFVTVLQGSGVGIGTTAPDQKLTVAGNISTTGQVISSGTGSNYFAGGITSKGQGINIGATDAASESYVQLNSATNRWLMQYLPGASPVRLRFVSPTAEVISITDTSGFVGIGTTAPASKMHISSSTIRIDGTGAPTTGGALCLNSAGAMAKCTSAIDASGNCTCP